MKGIVFTEFLGMVDEKFSMATTEKIIEKAALPSGGAYTAIGTYDHTEMVSLLMALSQETGVAVPQLLHTFGGHLLGVFLKSFPAFFEAQKDAISFLEHVDGYVHVEVRKLYADAQLPRFFCTRPASNRLLMDYVSERHLADLAHGLIEGTIKHYGRPGTVARHDIDHDGKPAVRFTITLEE